MKRRARAVRYGVSIAVIAGLLSVIPLATTHATPVAASGPVKLATGNGQNTLVAQPSVTAGDPANSTPSLPSMTNSEKLTMAQAQLTSLNAKLKTLVSQEDANTAAITQAQAQLASLIRQTYETTNNTGLLTALLAANNFQNALNQVQGDQHFVQEVEQLHQTLVQAEQQVASERGQIAVEFKQATVLQGELAQENARAQYVAPVNYTSFSGAHGGDHFSFGECTWYVAQRRYIPWFGNADQWYTAAAAMGFPEGHVPQVGAVVVFWPGGDGAGSVGHVAYVESVLPGGYFMLSEMNFGAWDRVDTRILPGDSSGIQGFIYNK